MKKIIKFTLCFALVLCIALPTAAITSTVQKTLHYNNIKVSLNNQEITPKDANGNMVEPFIIDGTTYLPVRAVGEAMGLKVDWDGNTNTVLLSNSSATSVGTVIYDSNGVRILYNGIGKNSSGLLLTEVNLTVENNTTQPICVQARDCSINDIMMPEFIFSCSVEPGKKAYDSISFYNASLEEKAISKISKLEFYFHIFNDDTWDDIVDSPVITITP